MKSLILLCLPFLVGASEYRDLILAQSKTRHEIDVRAYSWVEVTVRGSGNTNLDCTLYDARHRPVKQDRRPTDECKIEFEAKPQTFTLQILNRGNEENVYSLTVRETLIY